MTIATSLLAYNVHIWYTARKRRWRHVYEHQKHNA